MDSLSTANTTFALNLFKKLSANDPTKNMFFSPLSISSALLMVLLGAKGNTEAQMSKVLSVSKDREVHKKFEKLISEINKPDANYILSLANRLFGETSYDFLASFIESTEKFYHAGLEKLNFKQASEESRRHINAWVEEKTSGKIQDLLVPGIIDSLTKLVLVNAIYFKGNWADKFNKDHTEEKPFQINKNERKTVQMMFKKAKYNMTYISDYRTSILEIPYVDNKLSMIILLPQKIEDNSTGLEKLEREITYEKLMDWINPEKMDLREIELSFPKFKLEEKYDLKPVLRSMGMTDAFDEGKADLSGMSTNNDFVISEVVHKSFLEVNEEGSEAAAATAVDFLTSTQNLYGAELSRADFSNAPDKAKKEINQWVEQQTERKIPDLLSEGSINEMTKLVLVNAVYFKGSWAKAFEEKDTEDKPFRLNKTEKKNVKMMFMKEKLPFGYIHECNCRVLELPYKGEDLSMVILLPDEIEDNSTGLEQLEQHLTLENLQEWTQPKNMTSYLNVCVHLPKFQLEENYDLKSYFAALGIVDVFDSGKANLSGMSGSQDLHVSKIVHKSFLEVNEAGTEAAAATAVTVMALCLPMAEDFIADHPFIFFIRHNPTNTILFLGRFASP